MEPKGHEIHVLQQLYKNEDHGGDIVAILAVKGVSKEAAQKVGRKLFRYGYIIYKETREYGDAELTARGIDYVEGN